MSSLSRQSLSKCTAEEVYSPPAKPLALCDGASGKDEMGACCTDMKKRVYNLSALLGI